MRWEHSYCRGHRRTSLDKRLVSLAAHFTCSSGRVFLHCGPMSKSLLVNQERRRERRDPSCRKWEEAALAAAQSNQPQIRLDEAPPPPTAATDAPLNDAAARSVARYRGKKSGRRSRRRTAPTTAKVPSLDVALTAFLLVFGLLPNPLLLLHPGSFGLNKNPIRNVWFSIDPFRKLFLPWTIWASSTGFRSSVDGA